MMRQVSLFTENTDIQIELGAIGKGYAIEQAKEILTSSDASGGMISAGSSIYVYGKKPDGSKFRVALRDPRGDENSAIGVLTLSDITISTSVTMNYFEKDGDHDIIIYWIRGPVIRRTAV